MSEPNLALFLNSNFSDYKISLYKLWLLPPSISMDERQCSGPKTHWRNSDHIAKSYKPYDRTRLRLTLTKVQTIISTIDYAPTENVWRLFVNVAFILAWKLGKVPTLSIQVFSIFPPLRWRNYKFLSLHFNISSVHIFTI